nr:C10 family peptidase [Bacillota bacterium]
PNWISLVINELNNGRSIDYFGKNGLGYGGHSFVCDGYKQRVLLGGYKFHFNWGWNGKKDGWFVLDKLTPGNHNFSFYHKAIFNIYPTSCFLNIIMECGKYFSSGMVEELAAIDSFQNNGYGYIISNNASVHLQAGEEILLTNGFYAAPGSDFQATIAPCSSAATSFPDYMANGITDDNSTDTLPAPKLLQVGNTDAFDASLQVYPNPTDDLLYIELSGGAGISNVALYDLQGRFVRANNHSPLRGTTTSLDVKSVLAGVYILRVTDADGREYHRKVVRK